MSKLIVRSGFTGLASPIHLSSVPKRGILLTNLGTPDNASRPAVSSFLTSFLSDQRVVELPRWIWLPFLTAYIGPFRSASSVEKYERLFALQNRVLVEETQKLAKSLKDTLSADGHSNVAVGVGMRYGSPSISSAMQEMRDIGVSELTVLPLYPQQAACTTGTAMDAVYSELSRWRTSPALRTVTSYHANEQYVAAIADSLMSRWTADGLPNALLFSFHGLPQFCVDSGDFYLEECQRSFALIKKSLAQRVHGHERLGVDAGTRAGSAAEWVEAAAALTFQSRFGYADWLRPYLEDELTAIRERTPEGGEAVVDVVCPGFATDCLETLDEIDHELRAEIEAANAADVKRRTLTLRYVPCLNASDAAVQVLRDVLRPLGF